MKTLFYSVAIFLIIAIAPCSFAQTVNWRSIQSEENNIINLNAGWDYSAVVGVSYAYKMNTGIPLLIGGEFSVPAGNEVFDDLKTKFGGQLEVFRHNNLSASIKVNGIFRRYHSEFVRLANFGSEFSTTMGYYRSRWFAAAEFGFDKAIVTHVRHSETMKEYYPEIQNGWYIPNGGNFFYGLQLGCTFRRHDVYLKAGKIMTQDLRTLPAIPLYMSVGLNRRF